MSDPSEKLRCPDCTMLVQRKNISKHYRKMHPGLDPYRRVRESREEHRVRKPRYEVSNSNIAGFFVAIGVIVMLVVASLLVITFVNQDGDGLKDKRTVFFTASDGAIINATWFQSSKVDSPTVYLIHDIGGDRTIWNDYAPELQAHGYNVLAMDTRGHGDSTKSIIDPNWVYDYTIMSHYELVEVKQDIVAAYEWVHGDGPDGDPNTDAGEDGAFIGIGKGGQYAMNQFARMSQYRIISGVILSPTLENYGLDVRQVFQDYGDIRPIILSASEGDGTGNLMINTILTEKDENGEKNGIGFIIPGSNVGIHLLANNDLKAEIYRVLDDTWGFSPG
jgi:pimeloyl-ACP methyl ester carboxylesterase/uncharacterized C2H2 Zn-finger protein